MALRVFTRSLGVIVALVLALVLISPPAEAADVATETDSTTTAVSLPADEQLGVAPDPTSGASEPGQNEAVEPPTTEAPPVTEPPSTEVPVTEPPSTEAPPVTDAPVTDPPSTVAPIPDAPPVTDPPVTAPRADIVVPVTPPTTLAPGSKGTVSVTQGGGNVYLSTTKPDVAVATNPLTGNTAPANVLPPKQQLAEVGKTLPPVPTNKVNAIFTVAAGTVPPGVVLRNDGAFEGVPSSAGRFQFDAKVCDPVSCEVVPLDYVVAAAVIDDSSVMPWLAAATFLTLAAGAGAYRLRVARR